MCEDMGYEALADIEAFRNSLLTLYRGLTD